jgi:hypothetical protein
VDHRQLSNVRVRWAIADAHPGDTLGRRLVLAFAAAVRAAVSAFRTRLRRFADDPVVNCSNFDRAASSFVRIACGTTPPHSGIVIGSRSDD